MLKQFYLLLLCLQSCTSIAMELQLFQPIKRIRELPYQKATEIIMKENKSYKNFLITNIKDEDKELYEEALIQAPEDLKYLISLFQTTNPLTSSCNVMLFVGWTGNGKTLSAEAVAYALKRPFLRLCTTDFLSSYEGKTIKNFTDFFNEWRTYKEKPVIILDEISILTNHTDTGEPFWDLLAEFSKEKDFLCICTISFYEKNIYNLFPFQGPVILFDDPTLEECKHTLTFYLRTYQSVVRGVDPSCFKDDVLTTLAKALIQKSRRKLEQIVQGAFMYGRKVNDQGQIKRIISPENLLASLENLQDIQKKHCSPRATPEEELFFYQWVKMKQAAFVRTITDVLNKSISK